MACYVYMLRCKDNSIYTGWTTDLSRRLNQHNAGVASKCTASRRPVELVYSEELPDRPTALRREYAIKQLSRPDKLRLIAGAASGSAQHPGV